MGKRQREGLEVENTESFQRAERKDLGGSRGTRPGGQVLSTVTKTPPSWVVTEADRKGVGVSQRQRRPLHDIKHFCYI